MLVVWRVRNNRAFPRHKVVGARSRQDNEVAVTLKWDRVDMADVSPRAVKSCPIGFPVRELSCKFC